MNEEVVRELIELARDQLSLAANQGEASRQQGRVVHGMATAIASILAELESAHPGIGRRAAEAFDAGQAEYDTLLQE